jgi:light-regulated signal transduction histidine kinase (bacteriophytochrome)
MLKEDYQSNLDAEGNRIIDVIIDNTKMMSQLIDDLLTFSKIARLEVVSEAVDMKQLAEKWVGELLQTENRADYSINISNLPKCKGDENMLKQVWFNLIGNPIKYSFKKLNPQIEVSAIDDGKTNIYYVRDNGAGFDMKYSSKLFGVFQRLHRSDEFKGTGVGLALAKRIISKHSGEIWAEAELDKGAVFYFSIPK